MSLTQLHVVGVQQEVRQVEELWDQLSDVTHVVFGGRLPLLLHTVKHPLCDVKSSLWGDEGQHFQTPGIVLNQNSQQGY
mgnify:CR=1 FL=1